ncbi:hypothetical protein AB0C44_33160, partial [Micromonospora taraxaci]
PVGAPVADGERAGSQSGQRGHSERAHRAAAARNVRIYPASGYFVTRPPAEPTFLIGYAALPTARITEGVALLAAAVRESTAR